MFNKKKQELKEASSIDKMEEASFPILPLPFNGVIVLCKVRCLNQVQLKGVGEINLIDTSIGEEKDNYNLQDLIDIKNWQEALIRETLIEPTFEEIQEKVYGKDNIISERKQRLEEIKTLIGTVPVDKRKELENEANALELYIGSLLPDDFMNAVTSWATGTDKTDIKKVTREMLLEAAILADRGRDNPADHIQGNFLDIHKEHINRSAWIVFTEFQKDKELENGKGTGVFKNMRVIKGGKVK